MSYIDRSANGKAAMKFVRDAMSTPLLTREREQTLARSWRDGGDEAALHELVNAYTRLVAGMASKFRNYGLPMADLMQEGVIGLMQAANRFEPERNIRFSTYATWWVRSAMQDYILRNWSIVRPGTTSTQKSLFFNLRRLRARIEAHGGKPLDDQGRQRIAEQLRVPKRDVEAMESRLVGNDRSLDAPFDGDGDSNWLQFLKDDRPSPEENAIKHIDGALRHRRIVEALDELPERDAYIVRERLLTEEPRTLEAIGRDLGITKERVRQIEARALGRMRDSLEAYWKALR